MPWVDTGMSPLEGGHSGETFLAVAAGERTVVRVYGGRSRSRGPAAPEIDAAVLRLVRGLLPVPEVLEVRAGDPAADVPGLLVTSFLPGERLELVLPELDAGGLEKVGAELGVLLARLSHMVMPRYGEFVDADLTIRPFAITLAEFREQLGLDLPGLSELVDDADDLVALTRRTCLVHSDFNPKNVLVDPDTLRVTGLLDWEFSHAGSPFSDLGNLLRFEDTAGLVDPVQRTYSALVPDAPEDLLDRARAADLFALMELASRAGQNPVADRALDLLRALAAPYAG
jgi:aminoglycoside phosphotransferase (APT) family kinase protein